VRTPPPGGTVCIEELEAASFSSSSTFERTEDAMKRATMLLCTLALLGAAMMIPAAAAGRTCNCATLQTQCTQQCQADLCRRGLLKCNTLNPCDSTCTCSICAP
jgi:hypothetical protein